MRPHKLSLHAFGPYADKLTIDFEQLAGRSLFLICGPTGSGKSTLLDAMCYALFGETSGGERQVRDIRSQLAEPNQLTQVSFSFSTGQKRYRIERSPDQLRPKQRGQGVCEHKAECRLYEVISGETKQIACRPQKVNPTIRQIIGFDVNQFRQVVVLPQGQFRRLLLADSKQREAILASLFQTDEFQTIQVLLKQEAAETNTQIQVLEQQNQALLQEANVIDLQQLQELSSKTAQTIANLQAQIVVLTQQELETQRERDQLRQIQGRFAEYDQAQTQLTLQQAQTGPIQAKQSRFQSAQAAQAMSDLAAELQRRRNEQSQTAEKLTTLQTSLNQANKQLERAQSQYLLQQEQESERQALQKEHRTLQTLSEIVQKIQDTQKKLKLAQSGLAQAESTRDSHLRQQTECEQTIQNLKQKQLDLQIVAATHKACVIEKESLERLYSKAIKMDSKRAELDQQQRRLSALQQDQRECQRSLTELSALLERLTAEKLEGQAFELAQQLQPGQACPVCGSTSHPAPRRTSSPIPTDSEIQHARQKLVAWQTKQTQILSDRKASTTAIGGLQAWIEQNQKELGLFARATPSQIKSDLTQSEKRLQTSAQAPKLLDELAIELTKTQQELQIHQQHLTQAQDYLKAKELEAKALEMQHNQWLLQIPDQADRDPIDLQRRMQKIMERCQSMQDKLEQSQADLQQVQRKKWELQQQQQTYQETLEHTKRVNQEIEQKFQSRLQQIGFENEQAYLQAMLPAEQIRALEKEINDHNLKLQKALDRFQRAQTAIAGLARPEFESIEIKLARIKTELSGLSEALGANQDKLERLQEKTQSIQQRQDDIAAYAQRYALMAELAEVACDRSMTLERFVLASFLDEVLSAASLRLSLVSRGRYQLRRDQHQHDKRRSGGLDLIVFDAHTGLERSVATLSGGESFLAALSLALGLADVVQARSGGLGLDTMFVDEGFGALDPEALDMALQALMDINHDGKLIGIISHVPELKERIETRLEITPSRRGNQVRLVL